MSKPLKAAVKEDIRSLSGAERAAIIRLCCRQVPLAVDVDIDDLARRTEELTGADLESLCKKATLVAIAEYQRGSRAAPFVVTKNDFEGQL